MDAIFKKFRLENGVVLVIPRVGDGVNCEGGGNLLLMEPILEELEGNWPDFSLMFQIKGGGYA
jgi:hypothetical protein